MIRRLDQGGKIRTVCLKESSEELREQQVIRKVEKKKQRMALTRKSSKGNPLRVVSLVKGQSPSSVATARATGLSSLLNIELS